MKAYESLIRFALKHKHTVSVFDGEEWQVTYCDKLKPIIEAVESVEEAALRIHDSKGVTVVNSVTVSAFGLDDDETVIDYTICPFMNAWEAAEENMTEQTNERTPAEKALSLAYAERGLEDRSKPIRELPTFDGWTDKQVAAYFASL
jgi:hypothetical protein